jgi:hypothetical protein
VPTSNAISRSAITVRAVAADFESSVDIWPHGPSSRRPLLSRAFRRVRRIKWRHVAMAALLVIVVVVVVDS